MKKDLSDRTLGIIHAAVFTSQTVQKYLDEILPEVRNAAVKAGREIEIETVMLEQM